MAYIKTDWTNGMVISEAGLDHLENGVYNNSVAIGDLTDLDTTDKTNLVAAINEAAQSGGGGSLSNAVKDALLQIAAKVAYIDEDGQEYYDDLYDALYPGATIISINADYTQTGTVYPTASLDDLRNDLVVNAIYDNGSVVPVISYTLSGTLEEGTSTITVSYEGFTDTFEVTVSEPATVTSIAAVYTQSGTVYDTDTLDSLKADLVVTATYSDSSTATVPSADYTLSGTLTAGTSTITVTYEEETTTFNVTVTLTPLYAMSNGSFEFSGTKTAGRSISVTNRNHVTYTNPNPDATTGTGSVGTYAIFDAITANQAEADTTNINSPSTTLFTLASGANVVMTISNIVYSGVSGGDSVRKFAMALRSGSTSVVSTGDLAPTDTAKTVTLTMSANKNITCGFFYAGAAIGTLEFDITVTVNGVRWI